MPRAAPPSTFVPLGALGSPLEEGSHEGSHEGGSSIEGGSEETPVAVNRLMRRHSSESTLVLTNLPVASDEQSVDEYMHLLALLSQGDQTVASLEAKETCQPKLAAPPRPDNTNDTLRGRGPRQIRGCKGGDSVVITMIIIITLIFMQTKTSFA